MTTFERIKKLADKQGKSLQKVSEDLGLSQNYIYNLKGAKSPAADKLSLIADYFNVSVDYLIGRDEQQTKDNISFGERVKALRSKKKISVSTLAEELGVTPAQILEAESDFSTPDISIAQKIANYFDIDIDSLLGLKLNLSNIDNKDEVREYMINNINDNYYPSDKSSIYEASHTDISDIEASILLSRYSLLTDTNKDKLLDYLLLLNTNQILLDSTLNDNDSHLDRDLGSYSSNNSAFNNTPNKTNLKQLKPERPQNYTPPTEREGDEYFNKKRESLAEQERNTKVKNPIRELSRKTKTYPTPPSEKE